MKGKTAQTAVGFEPMTSQSLGTTLVIANELPRFPIRPSNSRGATIVEAMTRAMIFIEATQLASHSEGLCAVCKIRHVRKTGAVTSLDRKSKTRQLGFLWLGLRRKSNLLVRTDSRKF